jgi:23S rRNA pseudouridine1911/1915/1917 synthase
MSRSRLQSLIKAGEVSVDREVVKKSGFKIESGASINVVIPQNVPSTLTPEDIPLDVIHEDKNVLVVNKPAGMVVHPSLGHDSGTLVHAALAHAPDLEGVGGERRPGVVHRLDKDTSGIIILAKNDTTHKHLQEQFSSREVDKSYVALVDGAPPTPVGRVEAAIGRDPSHRQRMAVVPAHKGREAVSEYTTLEKFAKHALLDVHPITGRTHQIRVHMKFLKCPVAGDTVYGLQNSSVPLKRHFLHAKRLSIRLRDNRVPTAFEAPLAPELSEILDHLR